MSETPHSLEAAFDPEGSTAPDALFAEANERTNSMLQIVRETPGWEHNEQSRAVQSRLEQVAFHIGQATSALAAARGAKDLLLQGQTPTSGSELAQRTELDYVAPENRGWEDPRLMMSVHELVERLHNVNFRPYGSILKTGIQHLRDVFMAPGRLAEEGVIAREDTSRLIRELKETQGDLPAINQYGKPEPAMAAFLYETVDEVPADLVLAQYVESFMGHAVPKGQRVAMGDFMELMKQRTGLLEPLPRDIMQSMDVLKAAQARAGRKAGPLEVQAITEAFAFIAAFQKARRKGGRPPRADSDPWSRL